MRVGIIGSGSLGSLFAAFLTKEVDLILLGHWPEQMAALKKNGLTVVHLNNTESIYHFPVIKDPSVTSPVDIVLILVKSFQTTRAASEASSLLSSNGIAITLQNGLGNFEVLARTLGANRVIQGVTSIGVNMIEPGIVHHAGQGNTYIARSEKNKRILKQTATIFNKSGFKTNITENVTGLVWGKLAVNSAINPLTALLNVPNGFLVSNPIAENLVFETAEETANVAKALGIALPYVSVGDQALAVAKATADNLSSMLQDIRRGGPTEIDAICGQVVQYGRYYGVDTPLNNELFRLISSKSDKINAVELTSDLLPLNKLRFEAKKLLDSE